jgi:hypothetical protein
MSPAIEVIGVRWRNLRRRLRVRRSDAYVDVLVLILRRLLGGLAALLALAALLVSPLWGDARDRVYGGDGRGLLGRRTDRVDRIHQAPSAAAAAAAASCAAMTSA